MNYLRDKFPSTVEKAVEKLIEEMTFSDKTRIANMDEIALARFYKSYGVYLRNEFRLPGNEPLMNSCMVHGYLTTITAEQASYVIVKELQKQLIAGNTLKIIK